jgi:hypothetical protein
MHAGRAAPARRQVSQDSVNPAAGTNLAAGDANKLRRIRVVKILTRLSLVVFRIDSAATATDNRALKTTGGSL